MSSSTFFASSVFAICASLGLPALAQAPSAADPNAAPAPAMTAPDNNPVQTGVTTNEPTPVATSQFPVSTIPQAQDQRGDVVRHTWPNRPMLITGLVLFGGTYGASVIVGAASKREADDKLFLPVVGPWLDLKNRDCDVNDCGNDTLNKALLIGDGALQGLGAVTMLLSVVIPESTKKPWYLIGDEKLFVAPQLGTNATGLLAAGKF